MQFDPAMTSTETRSSLDAAATAAWGADAAADLDAALATAATSIWQIAQQPLEPADLEP